MTRSRLIVSSSFFVVVAGALAAGGALYLDPARAAVGPLQAESLAVPADTRFLVGIDVRRFVDSPFYGRFANAQVAGRPDAFRQIEERTGLDVEKDVDSIVIAGRDMSGRDAGVVLVDGRFDRYKLGRLIETKNGVSTKTHQGTPTYLFNEGQRGSAAVAFLDDNTLAMGSQAGVEAVIESRVKGARRPYARTRCSSRCSGASSPARPSGWSETSPCSRACRWASRGRARAPACSCRR